MKAFDILSLMKSKGVSFRVIQHGLKFNNLESAKGWELVLERYVVIDDYEVDKLIKELYLSQLFFGARTVCFNKIALNDQEITNNFINVIKNIFEQSQHRDLELYKRYYPYPINDEDLNRAQLNNPCPVFFEESDNKLKLMMTYPRAYKEKNVINIDEMNLESSQIDQLKGYEKIIGVKSGRAQSFDCIYFDKISGIIQFQIDHSKNILKDDIENAVAKYRRMIIDGYNELFNSHINLESINVFPKIDELYNSDDGKINTLRHTTGTGSVKTEKMRKRTDDLRKEGFHKEGLRAINGDTNRFGLIKQWDGEGGTSLKLSIDGGVVLVASSNPTIDCVTIEGCITGNDFNLLISKVI
ncbi:hypothetical protein ID852_09595 [Xenorhabdus sp. 42]|uniref:hypothetical protein n=1 Tax=Xenorhabdus szentirmaii TaxID=290112 RepID=UPI00198D262A|nr:MULTISPECIES: hypothetical protein [unclassified Xenorhabdus]MBD2793958.1 hypothetical protein [Xenorhabdus sp. CUL]MBD2820942.1 hypothetical protein [Xenorhabdus sp. 42]MBD2826457.1 hypothetical protein [Xenorhabdus sp. 5]